MIQLIYYSSAKNEMSETELLNLLKQSRERNKRQNVTGMLLYAGGNFFQVLEGEDKDVEDIFGSIKRDARNCGHIILQKKSIESRMFPEWSMGFKHLTAKDKDLFEGYTDFMESTKKPEEFSKKPGIILSLMHQFKEDNR